MNKALLLIFVFSIFCRKTIGQARIKFIDPLFTETGTLYEEAEYLVCKYRILNIGNDTLKMQCFCFCGCEVSYLNKKNLPPNDTAILETRMLLKDRIGYFEKYCLLKTNTGDYTFSRNGIIVKGKPEKAGYHYYANNVLKYSIEKPGFYYSDDNYTYTLTDTISSGILIVKRLKDTALIQKILLPKFSSDYSLDRLVIIEDINFDGYNDIRFLSGRVNNKDNTYNFWIYNPSSELFERYHFISQGLNEYNLESIRSPVFYSENKTIVSNYKEGDLTTITEVYEFIKDSLKVTKTSLTKRIQKFHNSEETTVIEQKWKDGKLIYNRVKCGAQ